MKKKVLILTTSAILSLACPAQISGISKSADLSSQDPGNTCMSQIAATGSNLLGLPPGRFDFQVPVPVHATAGMYPGSMHSNFAASTTTAAGAFPKGTFAINVGIGVGDVYWGTAYGSASGVAPTLILEYAITDKLGIGNIAGGLIISYGSTKYNDGYNTYKYSGTLVGLRGEYHFILSSDKVGTKLDPYGGVMLGYVITNNPAVNDAYNPLTGKESGFQPGIYAGAHYFFATHVGAYAEFGYEALFVFNFGLSFKFP